MTPVAISAHQICFSSLPPLIKIIIQPSFIPVVFKRHSHIHKTAKAEAVHPQQSNVPDHQVCWGS
jgi:predicted transcriptional regulator